MQFAITLTILTALLVIAISLWKATSELEKENSII
jgi:hypothetical protein